MITGDSTVHFDSMYDELNIHLNDHIIDHFRAGLLTDPPSPRLAEVGTTRAMSTTFNPHLTSIVNGTHLAVCSEPSTVIVSQPVQIENQGDIRRGGVKKGTTLMNLSSAMGLFSDFEAVKSAARPMSQISVFSIDCTTRQAIRRL